MSSILHKLRSLLFSPNSKLELRFRTIYHQVNATRLAFLLKNYSAKKSYIRNNRVRAKEGWTSSDHILHGPLVTFILTLQPQEVKQSIRTIQSLSKLSNKNWQLAVLLPDESVKEHFVSQTKDDDPILWQIGQSLEISKLDGEYLVFCQAGDEFFPDLLDAFNTFYHSRPDLNLYYFDCEYVLQGQRRPSLLCKPSQVNEDALLSVNLFSRGFVRKEFVISELPNGPSSDLEAMEYDVALFAAQMPDKVGHIPEVLALQKGLPQPVRTEIYQIIKKHLRLMGLRNISCEQKLHEPHFTWSTNQEQVAIIIPTKDHHRLLENLLSSIEATDYKNFSIYLVDNGSTEEATLNLYDQLNDHQDVHIIPFDEPFNYSRAINIGASESDSELILFMNDDMQIIHSDWLGELVQWAQRPEIGVVGTKLIRQNRTIQHAGIVMGLNAFAGHLYLNAPEDYNGLFGSVNWYRNYSALTGACQMVRRSIFNEVNGYDEDFQLAFGDVDFCLRIQSLGFRNLYTPFAEMYHFEGQSRGYNTPIEDVRKGYEKGKSVLFLPDPNYSEHLSLSVIPKYLDKTISLKQRELFIKDRLRFYLSDQDDMGDYSELN